MTKLRAIRWFCAYCCGQKIIITRMRMTDNFGMSWLNDEPRLHLPKDLNYQRDDRDYAFRKDFINRCPSARGFSNITLSLLHECGHWATRSVMNHLEYDKAVSKVFTQDEYMKIPWEHLATEWAICWLASSFNRKIAKEFEKDYFGYRKEQ